MPTYCVKLEDTGERRELILTFADMDRMRDADGVFTLEDGRTAKRDYVAELAPSKQIKAQWPMVSRAAAVNPSQVLEAKEHARKRGVNVDFDKKGNVILESPTHRKRYLKTRGLHDTGMSCDVSNNFR